jgi:uncharacterized DUF497 family protein
LEFEWDEEKRARVYAERGLDLGSADLFFDGRPTLSELSSRGGELRWRTVAHVFGALHTVVWTPRGEAVRIITMRRAHASEERAYRARHR